MPVLSMPLADTEQTAGLQSLTPDCLRDVGYAMFSVSPPFCCGATRLNQSVISLLFSNMFH